MSVGIYGYVFGWIVKERFIKEVEGKWFWGRVRGCVVFIIKRIEDFYMWNVLNNFW